MDVFYLIVKEAKRRKEKRKKEIGKEVCGGWWQGEVTGVRWKHVTHPRVPTTPRCSPPSALLLVRVPHRCRGHTATRHATLPHAVGQVGMLFNIRKESFFLRSQEENASNFQNTGNCTATLPVLGMVTSYFLHKIRISIVYEILVFWKAFLNAVGTKNSLWGLKAVICQSYI